MDQLDQLSSPLTTRCSITAVVVLYKRAPSDSQSLSALIQILNSNPELAKDLSVVIYDNSPQRHEMPVDFPHHYEHDPVNGGLAAAYNYALARAEQNKHEWLLLLDQDTSLTLEFLSELIACADSLHAQQEVAAIVPKLQVHGKIHSPQMDLIYGLRHPFLRSFAGDRQFVGLQKGRLVAYNSGATLRVSAIRKIGGFSSEFWLDYLDHAVFHALCASGHSIFVMNAVLEHGFAFSDLNRVPLWRHRNRLAAETLFIQQTGNFVDRLLHRILLLRLSGKLWASSNDRRLWKEAALAAIRLKTPENPGNGGRGIRIDKPD